MISSVLLHNSHGSRERRTAYLCENSVSVASLSIAKTFYITFPVLFPDLSAFRTFWRQAVIFTNSKCGALSNSDSFHPIWFILVNSKLFETTISGRLQHFFKHEGLLDNRQYGSRQRRFSSGFLILASNSWSPKLDNHGETRLFSHEISKAFDRVWHKDLSSRPHTSMFIPALTPWMASFFSRRTSSGRIEAIITTIPCKCWCLARFARHYSPTTVNLV